MLLMEDKGIRGGLCHAIYGYVKANNKYMQDFDKNKESTYLKYLKILLIQITCLQKEFGKILK